MAAGTGMSAGAVLRTGDSAVLVGGTIFSVCACVSVLAGEVLIIGVFCGRGGAKL